MLKLQPLMAVLSFPSTICVGWELSRFKLSCGIQEKYNKEQSQNIVMLDTYNDNRETGLWPLTVDENRYMQNSTACWEQTSWWGKSYVIWSKYEMKDFLHHSMQILGFPWLIEKVEKVTHLILSYSQSNLNDLPFYLFLGTTIVLTQKAIPCWSMLNRFNLSGLNM